MSHRGNLANAGKLFGWRVHPKLQFQIERLLSILREEHDNLDSPLASCNDPKQLVLLAEILRLGGSVREYERIRSHPAFDVDPTCSNFGIHSIPFVDEPNYDFARTWKNSVDSKRSFWNQTVHWLIANRDQITDDECQCILNWAVHKKSERNRLFSWKGRTPRSALLQAQEYQQLLTIRELTIYEVRVENGLIVRTSRESNRYQKWAGNGLSWIWDEGSSSWSFIELTSTMELIVEGSTLMHCVASYDSTCSSGTYAIVSMRRNDRPKITIQLELSSSKVIQARGICNRDASHEEWQAIHAWLKLWVKRESEGRPRRDNFVQHA